MTDQGLHLLARVLLRVVSPRRAHQILRRVGAYLPPHRDKEAVFRALTTLRRRGTCLTRALAVQARFPAASLVIGVVPPGKGRLEAHAWLEVAGHPLDPSETIGQEIARLGATEIP